MPDVAPLTPSAPANKNALAGGGPLPAEVERLRAVAEKHEEAPPVKAAELCDTAQIAARIRADIKAAVRAGDLPHAKYSVTTDKYSMGSSINVVASNLPFPTINPDAFKVERGANYATFDRAHFRSRFTPQAEEAQRLIFNWRFQERFAVLITALWTLNTDLAFWSQSSKWIWKPQWRPPC